MELNDALLALEEAAAVVDALLPDDEDELDAICDGWAPFPGSACSLTSRKRWQRDWIGWIQDCGQRWEARPAEPSADDLHGVIVRWAQR